jgi:deoxyadenosine/deoxycytidine kinase
MTKRFVLVAGNIGSGKTSLTERLGNKLGWQTAFESVDDNPYLADFYGDMSTWAFHLQIFFLGHRAEQHHALAVSSDSTIIDRSIYEDAEIFAKAALKLNTVTEREYATYRKIFDLVVQSLPSPDLLIYLTAPVAVLMQRIKSRGREMERAISKDYLDLLESYYVDWMDDFDQCPVLKIRTDDLDFVHEPPHLDIVVDRMQERLAGKEEVEFPRDV